MYCVVTLTDPSSGITVEMFKVDISCCTVGCIGRGDDGLSPEHVVGVAALAVGSGEGPVGDVVAERLGHVVALVCAMNKARSLTGPREMRHGHPTTGARDAIAAVERTR